jgi:hypothetical protein
MLRSTGAHMPYAHKALLTTREEPLSILAACDGSDGSMMSFDGEEGLACLWAVRSHCAIVPAGEQSAAVMSKAKAVAGKVGHIYAEELTARVDVPHADVSKGSRSKYLQRQRHMCGHPTACSHDNMFLAQKVNEGIAHPDVTPAVSFSPLPLTYFFKFPCTISPCILSFNAHAEPTFRLNWFDHGFGGAVAWTKMPSCKKTSILAG